MERVSATYLRSVFTSEAFLQSTRRMNDITRRTASEASFLSYKTINDNVADGLVGKVFYENNDERARNGVPVCRRDLSGNREFSYVIADVHSHPHGRVGPSSGDLFMASKYRQAYRKIMNLDARPIIFVSAPISSSNIYWLFAFQENTQEPVKKEKCEEIWAVDFKPMLAVIFLDSLFGALWDDYMPESDPSKEFEKSGYYKAALIKAKQNEGLHFLPEHFRKFSFTS